MSGAQSISTRRAYAPISACAWPNSRSACAVGTAATAPRGSTPSPACPAGVCRRDDLTGRRGTPPFATTRNRLTGRLAL